MDLHNASMSHSLLDLIFTQFLGLYVCCPLCFSLPCIAIGRVVLERPEYGYATYSFELVQGLPVEWQVQWLITVMSAASTGHAALLENRQLVVNQSFPSLPLHALKSLILLGTCATWASAVIWSIILSHDCLHGAPCCEHDEHLKHVVNLMSVYVLISCPGLRYVIS